jgi:hypothetical protein
MPSYPQARPHIPLGAQTSPPPKYILRGQTDSEADAETGGRPFCTRTADRSSRQPPRRYVLEILGLAGAVGVLGIADSATVKS